MEQLVGSVVGFVILAVIGLVGFALYMLPTIVAWYTNHRSMLAIGALNLLLGWSFLGWVVALVWALA